MIFKELVFLVMIFMSCSPESDDQNSNSLTNSANSSSIDTIYSAIVEWQFPISITNDIQANQNQINITNDPNHDELIASFFPHQSDFVNTDNDNVERMTQHAIRTLQTFKLNNEEASAPFLLNIASSTPQAIQLLINSGVRIFSFSSAMRNYQWQALEDIIKNNPDTLFFVATAHIQGNDISQHALNETPAYLALEGVENVILVGCLDYHNYHIQKHEEGATLGTDENPYIIDNQPTGDFGKYYLLNCKSTRQFAPRFGGTSAATPSLAKLTQIIIEKMNKNKMNPTRDNILKNLDIIMHKAIAEEKSGLKKEVLYFTLDTILLNDGLQLITDKTI